jgi:hypothetical protein
MVASNCRQLEKVWPKSPAGMTLVKTMFYPPVEVILKESACPVSPDMPCQMTPQFLDIWINPVLVPFTDMLLIDPLPATLVSSTSSK